MNQGDEGALRSLRTILSTKAVQNIAALAGSMANYLDCRNAPQNPRMPCFCAMRKIPLESRHFPTVKVLAHILIHKKCAERRDSQFLHHTERIRRDWRWAPQISWLELNLDRKKLAKAVFDDDSAVCLFFSHSGFFYINQGTSAQSKFLRTILSTKYVQNGGQVGWPNEIIQDCGIRLMK